MSNEIKGIKFADDIKVQAIDHGYYRILTRAVLNHGVEEVVHILTSSGMVVFVVDDVIPVSDLICWPIVNRNELFTNPELSVNGDDIREYLSYKDGYIVIEGTLSGTSVFDDEVVLNKLLATPLREDVKDALEDANAFIKDIRGMAELVISSKDEVSKVEHTTALVEAIMQREVPRIGNDGLFTAVEKYNESVGAEMNKVQDH